MAEAYERNGVILAAAVGIVGMTFGVLAITAGLSAWQAQAMSLLVFTGASQFAAVGVIDGGGSAISAVGSALLLAARNGIYGLRMAQILPARFAARYASAQLVIDESTGMALAQDEPQHQRRAFFIVGFGVFVSWNIGTLIGTALGQAIGDPDVYGLDAAFPASLVALIAPHVAKAPGRVAALVGAGIALLAVPLTPAGLPVLLAVGGVAAGLLVARRQPRQADE